jgi:hypothetical protein
MGTDSPFPQLEILFGDAIDWESIPANCRAETIELFSLLLEQMLDEKPHRIRGD